MRTASIKLQWKPPAIPLLPPHRWTRRFGCWWQRACAPPTSSRSCCCCGEEPGHLVWLLA